MPTKDPAKLKAKRQRKYLRYKLRGYSAERWIRTQARYKAIIARLGGRCEICGTREDLTIDHQFGRDYSLGNVSRILCYEQEEKKGLLRVLCNHHNCSDGARKFHAGVRNYSHHKDTGRCRCWYCLKDRRAM